jgi:anion transporter
VRPSARQLAIAAALGLLGLGLFPNPPEPLTPISARALGILGFAVVLWASGTFDASLVALAMMMLWPLFGVIDFREAAQGLGNSTVWLMIGIMLVGAAFTSTGLDQRIAYRLLYLAHGRTRPTVLWTIVTLLVMTFLVPTGVGRAGIMLPIARGMIGAIGLKRGTNVGKAIFLSAALVALQSGAALMTGSIATLYSASVFRELTGHTWTYLSWLVVALPPVFTVSLLAWPLLLWLYPPEVETLEGGREYLRQQIVAQGRPRAAEYKVALLFGLMVFGWITAAWHGLAPEQVCLLAMLLMYLPPWHAISFEDGVRQVSWSTVVMFAGSLSLAIALERSQLTALLVQQLQGVTRQAWPPPVIGLLTMVIVAVVRFGFPNTIGMIATVLPTAIIIAASSGVNPVWLGMLAIMASQILIVPVQSPTSLTLFSAGYFSLGDMARAGVLMALILILVSLLFAYLYWPLVGVPAHLQ